MPYVSGRVVHDADAHIMETPDLAARPRRPGDPRPHPAAQPARAATSCARPATPTSSCATWPPPSTGWPAKHALRRVPRRRGGGDHAAQELRRHRVVPRRGPAPRPRPARLLEPARVQHVPQPAAARLGAQAATSTSPSARPGPTTAAWSSSAPIDPRLLPTCYVPLCDLDRAPALADEAIAMGAAALLVASGCPPGHSPSHIGLDPVWARAQEAGIPVVFHVGGTGDLIDPAYFRNGLPDPARLPRRRGELPLGRLHGHPRPARADARHA